MILIPKIIHQIWSNRNRPLPKTFKLLSKTWKKDYPDWKYIFWDDDKIESFINKNYPQYQNAYNQFPYNIQRCDIIRYLILYKMGGMYIDFDYESIKSITPLIHEKTCCFAEEPQSHNCKIEHHISHFFNNAMILSVPNHFFLKRIIESIFTKPDDKLNINIHSTEYILQTTGPWKLMNLYALLNNKEKENIYIIPAKYVTPFSFLQTRRFLLEGERSEELENCLNDAYAVHYFFTSWTMQVK